MSDEPQGRCPFGWTAKQCGLTVVAQAEKRIADGLRGDKLVKQPQVSILVSN